MNDTVGRKAGCVMQAVIGFLREQARSIQETARRCTDPEIASELRAIADELYEKANELS